MIKQLIILICLLIPGAVNAQDMIDFNPKSLYPELKKFGADADPEIREIEPPSSLFGNNKIPGKFYAVEDENGNNLIRYLYIGRVNSCRAGGCSASRELTTNGESEYFDYFILYDKDRVVRMVKVFNYQATHGQEITSRGWLKQFAGYDGSQSLEVGKNIDVISGATISVYGITGDIQGKSGTLRNIVE